MPTPLASPFDDPAPPSSSKARRVSYFYDQDVGNYVYYLGHPMKPHRIRMAHNLIVAYGLCDEEGAEYEGTRTVNDEVGQLVNGDGDGSIVRYHKALTRGANASGMQSFKPKRATKLDMTRFHTDEYIDLLEEVNPDNAEYLTGGGTRCLIGEDCPPFEGVFEFCSISAGGSLGAAERINSGHADIAINWAGGLHHAKKTEASGFCYVNDIVLAILDLLRIHARVLYIDVDVHHGDGVEEAFYTTDRVMTASFHRFGEFFPGTGDVKDIGMGRGKNYAVNVPMRDGITNESFHYIFKPVISHIMEWFRPSAVVLQMGADSLSGDKLGGFNLTLDGHGECAKFVKSFNVPTIMLGGGGYTTKNVARAWTNETAIMCGKELNSDLPYNQYMEYYGPRYKLEVLPNNADDHNPTQYLDGIKKYVIESLRKLPHAPSAQMKEKPGRSVADFLGLKKDDLSDPEDEIEATVRKLRRKRDLNGTYSISSESEDSEDEYNQPRKRGQRQGTVNGGSRGTLSVRAQRRQHEDDDEDDPCGVDGKKKRTFFKSSGDTPVTSPWDVTGLGSRGPLNGVNGVNGISKRPALGLGVVENWVGELSNRVSRAGTPTSLA